jgi:hypothetical protein
MNVGSNEYLAVNNPTATLTDSGDPLGLSAARVNWVLTPDAGVTDRYLYHH